MAYVRRSALDLCHRFPRVHDRRGFARAVDLAERRLEEVPDQP
jgi:hypothetical protein